MNTGKYHASNTSTGNRKAVVVDGQRTPFVKSFGVFDDCDALFLYSRVVDALLRRVPIDPMAIDEIIAGAVIPQTKNPNVARDAALNLGLPPHIHGYTLNRACTSSLQTVADAARSIQCGQSHAVIAGGVECLSDVPIVYSRPARKFLVALSKARSTGERLAILSKFSASAWLPKSPALAEPLTGYTMGEHGEMMAKINMISREAQDQFALASHRKASAAMASGKFNEEICPVWTAPKFAKNIDADNIARADTSLESLAKLRPVFDRRYGTITAGNASPLTDGAAATLIADEAFAKSQGLKPKAIIRDVVFVGVNPYEQLLIGPAIAIPLLLRRNGLSIHNIDRFEIHEAFAAQVLSCLRSMESAAFMEKHLGESKALEPIPEDRLNVNGGAIAIGHPFGATGARLVTTMCNELQRSNKSLGIIAICAAGGLAGAMLLERAS